MNELKVLLDDLKLSGAKVNVGNESAPVKTWFVIDGRVHLVTSEKTLKFNKSTALQEIRKRMANGSISAPASSYNIKTAGKVLDHKVSGMVYKTSDYTVFNLHEKNREIDKAHVENLIKAIDKNNLLCGQPILVNESMKVIDGQHRLEAAKTLGVDIYYVKQDGLRIQDAIDLNINTKNWNYADYLDYWIAQGNEEYIYYKKYKETYSMSWSVSISLLHNGTSATRRTKDIFISGDFQADHKQYAEHIGRITLLLSRYCTFSNDRSLIGALDQSIRNGYLDPFILLKKVAMVPDKFTKCSDTESYLLMLESVVNHYKKGQRIRLY